MHRQVKIGNRAITIVDASIEHRGQQLDKYVAEYLKFVPREDLIGIGMIVLYDETPDGVPGTRKAGYLRSDPTTREAVIYLYLNWALGYPPYLLTKANSNSINKIREKILLTFLGKGVLALNLFHEIGHHKNTAISPKVYDTEGVA